MKLTDIIKLEKPEINFSDLNSKYQSYFYKQFGLTGALCIFGIVLFTLLGQYKYIFICLALTLAYSLYLLNLIYKSLTNHIVVLDAECINISKKEANVFGVKGARTCEIVLQTKSNLKINQSVPYLVPYKVGDTLRIYCHEGSISQINNNTYTIINPVFMHVLTT